MQLVSFKNINNLPNYLEEMGKMVANWVIKHPDATAKEISAFLDGMKRMQIFCHQKEKEFLINKGIIKE